MQRDPEIEKLLAEREIMRTQYRYSHAVDYNVEDEWVDCFTEDGTYTVEFDALPEETKKERQGLHGRAALQKFIKVRAEGSRRNTTGAAFVKHVPLLPVIDVAGDRASAVTYFVGFGSEGGLPVVMDIGRYYDKFEKCPDGRWRIKERIFRGEALRKQPERTAEATTKVGR